MWKGRERERSVKDVPVVFNTVVLMGAPFVPLQIEREKLHGCIDVGLSVMSVKKSSKCIDLDTEEHIYHLKVRLLPRCCLPLHRSFMLQRNCQLQHHW